MIRLTSFSRASSCLLYLIRMSLTICWLYRPRDLELFRKSASRGSGSWVERREAGISEICEVYSCTMEIVLHARSINVRTLTTVPNAARLSMVLF